MSDLVTVIDDLRAEGEELYRLLCTLEESDWTRVTSFKNWTINDVVQHLYFGDFMGVTSHKNGAEFLAFMKEVQGSGLPLVDFTRGWLDGKQGKGTDSVWNSLFCDR